METPTTIAAATKPPTFTPQQWECLQILFNSVCDIHKLIEAQDSVIATLTEQIAEVHQTQAKGGRIGWQNASPA